MRNPHAKVGERELSELVALLEKASAEPGMLKKVLTDILTPAELKEINARWQIIKRLAKGQTQREVGSELHISIATVARGAQALASTSGGFRELVHLSRKRK